MQKKKPFKPNANQRTLIAIGDGASLDKIKERLEEHMKGAGRPELVQVTIVQCSVNGWIKNDLEKGYVLTDAGKGEMRLMEERHAADQEENTKRVAAAREVKKEEAKKLKKVDTLDKAEKAERAGDTKVADKLREAARKMAP